MPLYSYQCKACEHVFDRLLSLSRKDEPKQSACPNCGEMQVQEHLTPLKFELNDVQRCAEFNDLLSEIKKKHETPKLPS